MILLESIRFQTTLYYYQCHISVIYHVLRYLFLERPHLVSTNPIEKDLSVTATIPFLFQ
jgi:hypothetical protein